MINLSEYLTESQDPYVRVLGKKTFYDFRKCGIKDANFLIPDDFNKVNTSTVHIWIEDEPYGKELKKRAPKNKKDLEGFIVEIYKEMNIKDILLANPTIGHIDVQFNSMVLAIYTGSDNPKNINLVLNDPRGRELAAQRDIPM